MLFGHPSNSIRADYKKRMKGTGFSPYIKPLNDQGLQPLRDAVGEFSLSE